jgi:hypothetical protein
MPLSFGQFVCCLCFSTVLAHKTGHCIFSVDNSADDLVLSRCRKITLRNENASTAILHRIALNIIFPHLRKLDISGGSVGPNTVEALSLAMKKTPNLQIINLDDNPRVGDKGISSISGSLRFNTKLVTLSLENCGIKDYGLLEVVKALSSNKPAFSFLWYDNAVLSN